MSKRTPKNKTPRPRVQESVLQLTPDSNFQLSGVSPPIRLRPECFVYNSGQQPRQHNYQNHPFAPPYKPQQPFCHQPMYRPTYEPPSPSPQPNQVQLKVRVTIFMWVKVPVKVRVTTIMHVKFPVALDSGNGSAPVEDDSPVEGVEAPAKGNAIKSKGFWLTVIEYFEKETGSHRGYDSILSKWKNRVRPRIGAFCAIFYNVQRMNESGLCDHIVYQKACLEYAAEYDHEFSLEPCWQLLKEHPAWKQVEIYAFYAKQNSVGGEDEQLRQKMVCTLVMDVILILGEKAQDGLNLNEDAAGSNEEVREVRPMGRDQARKKKSSTSSRFEASSVTGGALDEGFSRKNYVRKFLRALHPKWRAKVMAIEESKDLSSLALDELIGFDSSKVSISETKPISFVGSFAETACEDPPKRQTDPPSLDLWIHRAVKK
uniref:Glutathione S-transferase T3-like n=1 Tax=Tanacetum cinerariifolium TaxID=118510 RepID=A0A6L2KUG8_TANCI|nr:glutathione S-transferase T3-like [Tanacetum cinerariifolium]